MQFFNIIWNFWILFPLILRFFIKFSDNLLIVRYLKGIFNRHPSFPRYMRMWDIDLVMAYFDRPDYNQKLQFKCLVKKIVMLFTILGGRGKRSISTNYVHNIFFKDDKAILLPCKT